MTKNCFQIYKRSSPILRRSGSLRVPKFPKMRRILLSVLICIFSTSLISCTFDDDDKKTIYMQLLPDHSIEKKDVCGRTWISNDENYHLTFNENGSCVVSNYPRYLSYKEPYHDTEDKNDTTRITLYGRWHIDYNANDVKEVYIVYDIESNRRLKYNKYDKSGKRILSIGMKYDPFGGNNKYIPYYEIKSKDDVIYFHTYRVVQKTGDSE